MSRRVLDVCAVLSERCGGRCPREALGVIASPRGFMTGAVSLLLPDSEQLLPLDSVVYPIPGDPEECDALVFASSLARCVLVVEKESVFRRLVDDGFTRRLPCLLLTACGFPDYASRAALRRATDALDLPVLRPRNKLAVAPARVAPVCSPCVEAAPHSPPLNRQRVRLHR